MLLFKSNFFLYTANGLRLCHPMSVVLCLNLTGCCSFVRSTGWTFCLAVAGSQLGWLHGILFSSHVHLRNDGLSVFLVPVARKLAVVTGSSVSHTSSAMTRLKRSLIVSLFSCFPPLLQSTTVHLGTNGACVLFSASYPPPFLLIPGRWVLSKPRVAVSAIHSRAQPPLVLGFVAYLLLQPLAQPTHIPLLLYLDSHLPQRP